MQVRVYVTQGGVGKKEIEFEKQKWLKVEVKAYKDINTLNEIIIILILIFIIGWIELRRWCT